MQLERLVRGIACKPSVGKGTGTLRQTQGREAVGTRSLGGVAVGSVGLQLRHQQKVEDAVALVGMDDDDRSTGWRVRDEIGVWNLDLPPVRHVDSEWAKRSLSQGGLQSFGCHTAIVSPRWGLQEVPELVRPLASDLLPMAIEQSLSSGKSFGIFQVPDAAGFGAPCGHRQVGNRLTQSPIWMLLAQFGERIHQFATIDAHDGSPAGIK